MASEAQVLVDRRNAWKTLRPRTPRLLRRYAPRNDKVGEELIVQNKPNLLRRAEGGHGLPCEVAGGAIMQNKANRPGWR